VSHDPSVRIGTASLARTWLDAICDLYDTVFSKPPFHWRDEESQNHRRRLEQLLTREGFGIVIAAHEDELVGFAYGFTLPPDTKWWSGLPDSVPADTTTERPGRTFALIDFAVREDWRGRGVGRRLHEDLLASRSEERVTLTVQPTATETQQVYEHWGWQKVGQIEAAPDAPAPFFDVFIKQTRKPDQEKP
jgi:GNAT superfamily N-acetyltransferase